MAFPAFLDTCVLYGATLNDTLLRIAEQQAFRPHWSRGVLDELHRNLVSKAGLAPERASRRIDSMNRAFPDAKITGYEGLIDGMSCDDKDRHVLAAAVHARCEVLVTFNTRDFPASSLAGTPIGIVHPDAFLLDQIDLYPARVGRALMAQVTESARPRLTIGILLSALARSGAPDFAAEARRHEFDCANEDSHG